MMKLKLLVNRKLLLLFVLVIGIIISILYLFENYEDDDGEFMEHIDDNYFVKTSGCHIAKMDLMSDEIKPFFPTEMPEYTECGAPPITASDEKYLWINLTDSELLNFYNISSHQIKCYYAPLTRVTDHSVVANETLKLLNFGQRIKITSEYIQVHCLKYNLKLIYTDYHNFFHEKKFTSKSSDKYNVMIFGIDSISKMNFHRMMNKTAETIINDLGGIEMHGYNKVHDNTYPNLIPLLSGLSADELADTCLPPKSHFDNCSFVWSDFKKKGYSTMYAEDVGGLSLFNYFKKGFDKQPVDYYFRTMIYQMEKKISHTKVGNFKFCLGHRRRFDVFMDGYLRKFIKSMPNELTFSFFWTSSMTHDSIYYPLLIDDNLSNFLRLMKDEKYLDKTILLILSDHGMRFGGFRERTLQGMVEERLPSLFAVFPKSFKDKYNLAVKNFKRNSRRLTTHFDVYETLKDLSQLDDGALINIKIKHRSETLLTSKLKKLPRGISLFLEVPEQRTCDQAGIVSHWCMCYDKLELPNSDHRVQKVAKFVVKTINDIIKPFKACQFLYLNSVISAYIHKLNDNVLEEYKNGKYLIAQDKLQKNISDITLKITTKPGPHSEYEATVRIDEIKNEIKLSGIISRLSTYTKGCVKDSFVEKYCYCNDVH